MSERKLELLVQILKTMNGIQESREKKEGNKSPQSPPINCDHAALNTTHS